MEIKRLHIGDADVKTITNNFLNSNLFSLLIIAVCRGYLIIVFLKMDISFTFTRVWQVLTLTLILLQAHITLSNKNRKETISTMSVEETKIIVQFIRSEEDIKAIKKYVSILAWI